eukprot:7206394-Prymnesium_polylepis.1
MLLAVGHAARAQRAPGTGRFGSRPQRQRGFLRPYPWHLHGLSYRAWLALGGSCIACGGHR